MRTNSYLFDGHPYPFHPFVMAGTEEERLWNTFLGSDPEGDRPDRLASFLRVFGPEQEAAGQGEPGDGGEASGEGQDGIHLLKTRYQIIYALVNRDLCLKKLREQTGEGKEYYDYWDRYCGKDTCLEGFLDTNQIRAARVADGMLERAWREGNEQDLGLFMGILRTGFKGIRNSLKRLDSLTKEAMLGIIQEERKNRSLPLEGTISLCSVALSMAEDMGIPLQTGKGLFWPILFQLQERWEECLVTRGASFKVAEEDSRPWEKELSEGVGVHLQKLRRYLSGELARPEEGDVIVGLARYMCDLEKQVLKAGEGSGGKDAPEDAEEIKKSREKLSFLSAALERERKELESREKACREQIWQAEHELKEIREECERYQKERKKQSQELTDLRAYIYALSKDEGEKGPAGDDSMDEAMAFWKRQKVTVVGGHQNWVNKLRQVFPDWQFVRNDIRSFSPSTLKGQDYILCNTDFMNHAAYYKLVSVRSEDQKFFFLHSTNITLALQELEAQRRCS